jgi:hypothetical protein
MRQSFIKKIAFDKPIQIFIAQKPYPVSKIARVKSSQIMM